MSMRSFGTLSVTLHVAVLLFGQFGLTRLFVDREVSAQIIPVEIVNVSSKTVAPPPPEETQPPLPEPPQQVAAVSPPPPLEVAPEPPPPAVEEADVVPAPPEPIAEPEAKPEPPPPLPVANARPRAKPKPPVRREFANVLKDLAREDKQELPRLPLAQTLEPLLADPAPAPETSRVASIAEVDALAALVRRQIERCWIPPIGAINARDLVVRVLVRVDRAGFVREAQVLDAPQMALNPFFEAAADSARRAVLNDRCHPLDLPQDRYELWKEIELTFNPSEMLG